MQEIWKPIKGYEGLYEVSNLGRVKSLKRLVKVDGGNQYKKFTTKMLVNERILIPVKHKNGYLFVHLKGKQLSIHRLVANAFLTNQKNKSQVNHIDGNKQNNCVFNLEWVNAKENTQHACLNNLIKHRTTKVQQFDLQNNFICEYESIKKAEISTNAKHISSCCKGERKSSGGYKWRYANEQN